MDWYLYMVPLYSIQASFTNTQVIILYALLSLLTLTLTFSILFDTQVCWDFATSLSINSHLAVLLSHSDNLMNLQHWSSHSCNVFHSVKVFCFTVRLFIVLMSKERLEKVYIAMCILNMWLLHVSQYFN